MQTQLKVLFIPIPGVGHINACISLGQQLIRCQHTVVFAINEGWKGVPQKYGFEEVIIKVDEERGKDDSPAKNMGQSLVKSGYITSKTPLEKATGRIDRIYEKIESYKRLDHATQILIQTVRPNVIVIDQMFAIPSVETSGIPWVWSWSGGPLLLYGIDDDIPPPASGLSVLGDRNEWIEYKNKIKEVMYEPWKRYNDYVVSRGAKPLKEYMFCNGSPYLNVYGFPKELDYSDYRALPKNYIRFDNLMRQEMSSNFDIPEQLRGKGGKLIYFSMGSMGGADVDLMRRLVSILSKSKHRFIVSKGPKHNEFELSDNMWGKESVPQLEVLPLVDSVISHGGHNTVNEAFFFGKPMIALHLFGDQYDNAQRLQEKGLGISLDPYQCSEEELLTAIESLLNDKQLNEKLTKISQRIQTEKSVEKFPQLIENLFN